MSSVIEKLRSDSEAASSRNKKHRRTACTQTDLPPEEDETAAVTINEHNNNKHAAHVALESPSLVCNIPEHHQLEDLVHEYQEQLGNLKAYIKEIENEQSSAASSSSIMDGDNLAILEKRAEFEALDLAINERKQQLINLEMAKNRRLDEMESTLIDSTNENNIILKDQIKTLETTLKKRKLELRNTENDIKMARRDISKLNNIKNKIEDELEHLMKEKNIFNKKADKATMELIMAKEELEAAREAKKSVEKTIETVKADLVEFLNAAKQQQQCRYHHNHGFDAADDELATRMALRELNVEIGTKRSEIDELTRKSEKYLSEIKSEVNALAKQKEHLNGQLKTLSEDMNEKESLHKNELEKILKSKEKESKSLKDIQETIEMKKTEIASLEADLVSLVDNLENLREAETCQLQKLDEISTHIKSETQTYDDLKRLIGDLASNKDELESRLVSLSHELDRLNETCFGKEQSLAKIVSSIKQHELELKRLGDERIELEREKASLSEQAASLNEKLAKRRADLDALDEASRSVETRLGQTRADLDKSTSRLRELNAKCESKKQLLDQLVNKYAVRKDELEQIEAFLDEAKHETQCEQKSLHSLQNEVAKQKKILEELKNKLKTVSKLYEENQAKLKSQNELESELESKEKYISELETKLTNITSELENSIKRNNQEDCFKLQSACNLDRTNVTINTDVIAAPVSSLLITPTLKKPVVVECPLASACLLDEPTRMREILARNFEERQQNLERSKQQTRNIIESLKLNINDIELMTTNNIFKITTSSFI